MTDNVEQRTPTPGMQVHGADGERIGQIDRMEDEFMVVKKGLMLGTVYVPSSLVGRIENGVAVLRASKDEVEAEDWTSPAEGTTMTLGNTPAEQRTDALNEVGTTARPGKDAVVDVDTEAFDDRTDMDTNRRPGDTER